MLKILTESQRVTKVSMAELQANAMISSMIAGMKVVPFQKIASLIGKPLKDEDFAPSVNISTLGIPSCPSGLQRLTTLRLINKPVLPGDRFSNPWGNVLEIDVSIRSNISSEENVPGTKEKAGKSKPVLRIKGFRSLEKVDSL